MNSSKQRALAIALTALAACILSGTTQPGATAPPSSTLFDPSPAHPWNRLHSALFMRTAPDGTIFGEDEVDPLFWPYTRFLLEGDSNRRATAELDHFISTNAATMVKDPLKRAILQSELWALFDWTAAKWKPRELEAAGAGLQSRLGQIIWQLRLSDREIQNLPDNYADAVESRQWPGQFDPDSPDKPFLPPDLLDENGPWVLINNTGRMSTPVHFALASGRSAFLVFIRLPGGRQATLGYLKQINDFPTPLVLQSVSVTRPGILFVNSKFPQFPVGTELALLRRLMLIDDKGEIVPTRLVESAQIRVYRRTVLDTTTPSPPTQEFTEFQLRKSQLFSARAGGFVAMKPGQKKFLQMMAMPFDPLEEDVLTHRPYRPPNRPALDCIGCHAPAGVFSFMTFQEAAMTNAGSPNLRPSNASEVQSITIGQKRAQYDWGLLMGLERIR
jgi:hypothetical protein